MGGWEKGERQRVQLQSLGAAASWANLEIGAKPDTLTRLPLARSPSPPPSTLTQLTTIPQAYSEL